MSYPALKLLLQGYLSLDWPDDHANAWAAIDDYVTNEPIASQLPDEVGQLVERMPSEEGLHSLVMGELGCGYLPEADGFTMTAWLLAVRERVLGALDG